MRCAATRTRGELVAAFARSGLAGRHMKSLADDIRFRERFLPTTLPQFLALQLARGLNDVRAVKAYIPLVHLHPELIITQAFREVAQSNVSQPLYRLAAAVERQSQTLAQVVPKFAGLRIERRVIGIVLMNAGMIEYADVRELSFETENALKTTNTLLSRLVARLDRHVVAVESCELPSHCRRAKLYEMAQVIFRSENIPFREVRRAELVAAYGDPEPQHLRMLRTAAGYIWPTLQCGLRSNTLLDAAAVAHYVHVARQLRPDSY